MIVGLSGYARSGKDTVADHLVAKYGFVKMSFADPMRSALLALDPTINVGGSYTSLSQAVRLSGWENLKSMSDDIRPLMQRLGTEVGRKMFGENFWINLAMNEAVKHEKVVFADVRFKNEADAITLGSGSVWRIERPGFTAANDHISEIDMDDYDFNGLVLENDHTIKSLNLKVDSMYKHQDAIRWLR
jgi:hypothetical protein